jgi:WD40 repeat protein
VSHSKLFALVANELTAKLSVEQLGVFPHGGRLATFTPQGDTIILVTPDSEVQIHPFLDEQAPTSQFPYSGDRGSYINKLAVSPDGKTFAISSSSSLVLIQSFDQNIPPQTLPQSSSAITSLAFLTPTLLSVTLADKNRLLLFESKMAEWVLHPWCRDAGNMPGQIGITMDKCLGTFITDEDPSTIWLWGANWLAWIRPDKDGEINKMEIDTPSKEDGELATTEETAHWITYRYREVLLIDCLSSTSDMIELVVVERPRHEILEDITEPRFYRHEYGT